MFARGTRLPRSTDNHYVLGIRFERCCTCDKLRSWRAAALRTASPNFYLVTNHGLIGRQDCPLQHRMRAVGCESFGGLPSAECGELWLGNISQCCAQLLLFYNNLDLEASRFARKPRQQSNVTINDAMATSRIVQKCKGGVSRLLASYTPLSRLALLHW